jgi:precorrin-2 dehydrogenase/sirohydrochlorin ferrochelatase
LTPSLNSWVKEEKVEFLGEEFQESHLEGVFLVIAATSDARLNQTVGALARERGLLVNAVDQPQDCNFIVPSILRRGELTIAISTSGKSPAFARKVRMDLEAVFGDEYRAFLNLMGHLRGEVLSQGRPSAENSRIFKALVDSDLLRALKDKDWEKACSTLNRILGKSLLPDEVIQYLKDAD